MGRIRRNTRGRQAAQCGRFTGVAAFANGAIWPRFPGLRKLPRLPAVEQRIGLFDHGRLSRDPDRRFTAASSRQSTTAAGFQRRQGAADYAVACGLRRRQSRRLSRLENTAGGESDADEIRPAGRFLSNSRTLGADADLILKHDPEKLALGLDPWVGTDFPPSGSPLRRAKAGRKD